MIAIPRMPLSAALRGRHPAWRSASAAAPILAVMLAIGAPAVPAETTPAPLELRYEAYVAGFPALTLDFSVRETPTAYEIVGRSHATGLLGWLSDYTMRGESRGTIAGGRLHPSFHESISHSRRRDCQARLDYAGDGVATALSPATPDQPPPTPQQIVGTVDPLTAVLAISHAVARTDSCAGVSMPVYDGRRRYDLAFADEGVERAPAASQAFGGEMRRCAFTMTKIAGFSYDRDSKPHVEHGQVWLLPPRPGAPALPRRVDCHSDWGTVTVRLAQAGSPG